MSIKKEQRKSLMSDLQKSFEKEWGPGSVANGSSSLDKKLNVISSGSLALDYELGIGGWPRGYLASVYGPRDIGKTSIIGLNAIRSAQAQGLNCAMIAMEPAGENWLRWAEKHGVNVADLFISYPENGEQAFKMLHKMLRSDAVDLVLFDSLGALASESEMAEDGKARMGGQAGLITWGVKVAAPLAYKYNTCVIFLNQVRANMSSPIPGNLQQPGGFALEHHASIIVRLRKGKEKYTKKIAGTDVVIGQQIVAIIERNKMAEGSGQKAIFDFYNMDTDGEYPFGMDTTSDIVNTARRTGVIDLKGAWYTLPNGTRFQGMKSVGEYLDKNPDVRTIIREGVLEFMLTRNTRTTLEAVVDGDS